MKRVLCGRAPSGASHVGKCTSDMLTRGVSHSLRSSFLNRRFWAQHPRSFCSGVSRKDNPPGTLKLPSYLVQNYTWAYLTPFGLKLDNGIIPNTILWGNMDKLVNSACSEFQPGQNILQVANVYGHLSSSLLQKLGPQGHLDLIDIAPIQVEHAKKKLSGFKNVSVNQADATINPGGPKYDATLCFFLLHEVPDAEKSQIVNSLLERTKNGGKIVFVDYHMPSSFNPLKWLMVLVWKVLEPYALGLVKKEIKDFVTKIDPNQNFDWKKETSFGGLYQKVIVTKL